MPQLGWRAWWAIGVLVFCLFTRRWVLLVVFAVFYGVLFYRSWRAERVAGRPGTPSGGQTDAQAAAANGTDQVHQPSPGPVPPSPGPALTGPQTGPQRGDVEVGERDDDVLARIPEGQAEIRGVEVVGYGHGFWQVGVWALEFVREEPLESELRAALAGAMSLVPGVASVDEDGRETYAVEGGEDIGEALLAAAAEAIDGYADRIAQHIIDFA